MQKKPLAVSPWAMGLAVFLGSLVFLAGCSQLGTHPEKRVDLPPAPTEIESREAGVELERVIVQAEERNGQPLRELRDQPLVMKGLFAGRAAGGRVRALASPARHAASEASAPMSGAVVVDLLAPACAVAPALPDRDPGQARFHTEEYDAIYENPFRGVIENPLSTFSIDVDTASYANTRRFLNDQQLPPKDAVRIEELINYFTYNYPQPEGADPVSVTTELAVCPWNEGHRLALVGLQARSIDMETMPPNNLTFLLDVSGSMNAHDKLPLLKSAMKLLVDQMRPQDRVAIAVYAGAAGLVLDSTPGSEKEKIMRAIERLSAGGSTAGGAGIELAYKTARENYMHDGNNRVILATDGDFNVGVSSDAELVRMIEARRDQGIFLTVLGFGTGNYKDSKMEQLADKGNGNYAYIDDILEARKALVHEMGSTLVAVAKDVKLQIEFNPGAVKAYRLIGYENRVLAKEDFNDDRKDAGEMGAGHTVTALYELIPAGSEEVVRGVDPLKYQKREAVDAEELMTVKVRYKEPDQDESRLLSRVVPVGDGEGLPRSANLQFASAVAEFGLLLRDSDHKGNSSYAAAQARAQQAVGEDPHGYRAEFVRLVEKARLLSL